MTTEHIRALLERALEALNSFDMNYGSLWRSSRTPEQIDSVCSAIRAELAKPATAPSELAGQGAALYGQLIAAVNRLLSAQNEPELFGCVGPSQSEIAHRNLMQLIQHVCTGIDSLPTPATAPEQPAWHDAPTETGLWVRAKDGCFGAYLVNESAMPILKWSEARWYGPIPQEKEGGAA